MGLFSFLKRDDAAAAPAPKKSAKAPAADDVQVLRIRARRRLIGAAVLVAAGVVGFPLIFETQPRPIPVDLPIEIPRKETAPPLAVPTREPVGVGEPVSQPAPPASAELPAEPKVADKAADKPSAEKPAADKPAADRPAADKPAADRPAADRPAADKPPVKLAEKGSEKPVEKPAEKAIEKAASVPKAANDGARAQALLEGKEPTAARYIVQVGAYSENKTVQDVRAKVEKLGLKTYAQAVDTSDGHRVRVRLGPFASREEAERAATKLKSAGLPGSILTL